MEILYNQEDAFENVSTEVFLSPTHQMFMDTVIIVENLEVSWCVSLVLLFRVMVSLLGVIFQGLKNA